MLSVYASEWNGIFILNLYRSLFFQSTSLAFLRRLDWEWHRKHRIRLAVFPSTPSISLSSSLHPELSCMSHQTQAKCKIWWWTLWIWLASTHLDMSCLIHRTMLRMHIGKFILKLLSRTSVLIYAEALIGESYLRLSVFLTSYCWLWGEELVSGLQCNIRPFS